MYSNIPYKTGVKEPQHKAFIDMIIAQCQPEQIIETGTYDGLGSTSIFAESGLPVLTMECNAYNYTVSRVHLTRFKNVKVHHAYSLKYEEMIEFMETDEFLHNVASLEDNGIYYESKDPVKFYRNELEKVYAKPKLENLLMDLIMNERKQLIFLDSSGGIGFLEFQKVMGLPPQFRMHKHLLLDDLNHIKHYRSLETLKRMGLTLQYSEDERLGYCQLS